MILRINTWITNTLLTLAAVLAFLLSFLVCADVIGRVAFDSPVKGTPEIVSISIVIICFLQAGFAIRSGGMIRVDAVTQYLPARVRVVLTIAGYLVGAAFFALIFWGSLEPAQYSWVVNEYEGEGALRVPVWPARFVVVLGTLLAAFNYLLLAARAAAALRRGQILDEGPSGH